MPADPARFITENLNLTPVPAVPEVSLFTAHSKSGLSRLQSRQKPGAGTPPYWAHPWAGGMALARYFLDHPSTVAGSRILDLGAGSGLVAIAARLAGAEHVVAAEIDTYGRAAIALNARANGVTIAVTSHDFLRPEAGTGGADGCPEGFDVIALGDMFYNQAVAERALDFLNRCRATNIDILVGDPGRTFLPRRHLDLVAEYVVPDFGEGAGAATGRAGVYQPVPVGPAVP